MKTYVERQLFDLPDSISVDPEPEPSPPSGYTALERDAKAGDELWFRAVVSDTPNKYARPLRRVFLQGVVLSVTGKNVAIDTGFGVLTLTQRRLWHLDPHCKIRP